jgi:hypothetical protein
MHAKDTTRHVFTTTPQQQNNSWTMDDDEVSHPENSAPTQRPPVATPEQDHAEAAAAAAEVAAMEQRNTRGRDPTGDQALMGASNDDGNVDTFEATDESGELVRQAFLQFLQD